MEDADTAYSVKIHSSSAGKIAHVIKPSIMIFF